MIPISIPNVDEFDFKYVQKCLEQNVVSSVGEYVNEMEDQLVFMHSSANCVLTSSGTSALHVALVALGINSEDLVLTQSYSFVATANAIAYTGASIGFIDIDNDTLSISVAAIDQFVLENCTITNDKDIIHTESGKRLKCIVPALTFGKSPALAPLLRLREKYNLNIVFDAAGALGNPSLTNEEVFKYCDALTYSFNGNKIITTGGGGAVLTRNKKLFSLIKHLSTTARNYPDYEHDLIGFNYRMPNLNAALGLSQLEKLNTHIERKREIYERVSEVVKSTKQWEIVEHVEQESNYWLCALRYIGDTADLNSNLIGAFASRGITFSKFWQPIHKMQAYAGSDKVYFSDMPITYTCADSVFLVPCSASILDRDLDLVTSSLGEILT